MLLPTGIPVKEVVLPSLDREAAPLGRPIRREIRRRVEAWSRLRGRWRSGPTLIMEEIEEIWAYCSATEFNELKPSLIRLAETLASEANQEALAILVDSGLEIVTGGRP